MDLILLNNEELDQLVAVTKEMMEGISLLADVNCFDFCDMVRERVTTYLEDRNQHIIKSGPWGGGQFFGCICRQIRQNHMEHNKIL